MTVEFTTLGRTGISISRLCIGGWQVADWQAAGEGNFERVVSAAVDCGLNFIDTAESYGDGLSERVLARVVRAHGRGNLVIASKFSANNSSPERLNQALHATLKRLDTDYLDIYYQHWPTHKTPPQRVIDALLAMKASGKIRAIGVSNWTRKEWAALNNLGAVDVFQTCYNLIHRSAEKTGLPLCAEHGIAVLPYSPLAQGVLAGRFKHAGAIPQSASDPRRQNRFLKEDLLGRVNTFLVTLEEIAGHCGKTPAQVALRWLLQTPGITAPIIGMSNEAQLAENLGVFGWQLDGADYLRLGAAGSEVAPDLTETDRLWTSHASSIK